MEYHKQITWISLMVLVLCCNATSTSVEENCNFPEIKSPSTPLQLYQQLGPIEVTAYHCLYQEERICDKESCSHCDESNPNGPTYKNMTFQYHDVTNSCLNATRHNVFNDKHGYSYKINKPNTYSYSCGDNATFTRIVKVTVTKYVTKASAPQDRIVLASGTTCKYSAGFCHDDKEDIDVVWNIDDNSQDTCSYFKRIIVTDLYYFVLQNNTYAIIQSLDKFFVAQLEEKYEVCGATIWSTNIRSLLVAEGDIPEGNNNSVEVKDEFQLYFQDKQDVYNFLTDECIAHVTNSSGYQIMEKSFGTRLQISSLQSKLDRANDDYQQLRSQVRTYSILSCFAVLGVVVIGLYFAYDTYKRKCYRNGCNISRLYPRPNRERLSEVSVFGERHNGDPNHGELL